MIRSGEARWTGSLQKGHGSLSTESGVLNETPYAFTTRFEEEKGTNPEELIGAAHAGCFSMAFAQLLSQSGFTPRQLKTIARVSFEKVDGQWTIISSQLEVEAEVAGIDEAKLQELAEEAKSNCPVSRVLKANLGVETSLSTAEPVNPATVSAATEPWH